MRTSYPSLLRTAGFVNIIASDLTPEYRATLQRWIDATDRRGAVICDIVGEETYNDRRTSRRRTLQAIDDGLLSRYLYTAGR